METREGVEPSHSILQTKLLPEKRVKIGPSLMETVHVRHDKEEDKAILGVFLLACILVWMLRHWH